MSKFFGELVLTSRPAQQFMKVVGITADPLKDLEGFLQDCNDHNPRFNGAGPDVRYLYGKKRSEWATDFAGVTMMFASHLHMISGENPLTGRVDYAIAPGGARWSPLDRAGHIINQILNNKLKVLQSIIIAGSSRLLKPDEKELDYVKKHYPDAEIEAHLVVAAERHIHNIYPDLPIITVHKDDARSGNDGVIDRVMEEIGGAKGLCIGAVTTQIYHVGLSLDMARARKRHGWSDYEAAGHCSTPWMVFDRSDDTYFIECLTTLYKACQAFHAGC